MQRRAFLQRLGTVTTVGAIGIAGCSGGDGTPTQQLGENEIGMYTKGSSYYFDPIGLHVEPGETVTWVGQSGTHTSTSYSADNGSASETRIPDGAAGWNSPNLSAGGTFEQTFETEGTYDYFCVPHKSFGMVGRIVVGQPGGPADGSDPPDGAVPDGQPIVDQGSISYGDFVG